MKDIPFIKNLIDKTIHYIIPIINRYHLPLGR